MEKDSLLKFIREKLDEGVEKGKLRELLFETGFLPSEIEEAFKRVESWEIPSKRVEIPEIDESEGVFDQGKKKISLILAKIPKISRKKLKRFLAILLLILLGACGFYAFTKIIKVDPVSLLPEETSFYLRIKINSSDKQVKSFQELLNKFPNYEKINEFIKEEFEEIKQKNPIFANADLANIGKEVIIGFIFPPDQKGGEPSLIFVLSEPDLKKIKQIIEDTKESIKKEEGWEIKEENYRGVKILRIIALKGQSEINFCLIKRQVVISSGFEEMKKVIDVVEAQKITNVFQKNQEKNITQTLTHQKVQKYLTKNYLLFFYGQWDLLAFLKTAEKEKALNNYFSFEQLLKAAVIQTENSEKEEKLAIASAVSVDKGGLKTESYYFDTKEKDFFGAQFSLAESLANFVPAKIGEKDITFYEEGKNLESSFELFKSGEGFEESIKKINEILDIDIKKDLLPLFAENYAIFIASEPKGVETPLFGLIFEIEDENQAINQLLKIRLPGEMVGLTLEKNLSASRFKAKDARLISDMLQLQTVAEFIYANTRNYRNFTCNYQNAKIICDDIFKQAGTEPIIYCSASQYCAYLKLNEPSAYYCIDSKGGNIKTYIEPYQRGYCSGNTFICPAEQGIPSLEVGSEPTRVGFSPNIIEGFEIYSLPIFENFGLNFSAKDKKLILAFTQEGMVSFLKNLDTDTQKLKDNELFLAQFQKIPGKINSLSYFYPNGLLGLIKYGTSFYINFMDEFLFSMMAEEGIAGQEMGLSSILLPQIFEFLDQGIAPYLKMFKAGSSYSFSPEKGFLISKGRLDIEELNIWEKQTVEEFWENIQTWLEENFVPLMEMFDLSL